MSIWSSIDLEHLDDGLPLRDSYTGEVTDGERDFADIAVSPLYHDNVRLILCGQVSAADARFLAAKLVEAAAAAEEGDASHSTIDARVAEEVPAPDRGA